MANFLVNKDRYKGPVPGGNPNEVPEPFRKNDTSGTPKTLPEGEGREWEFAPSEKRRKLIASGVAGSATGYGIDSITDKDGRKWNRLSVKQGKGKKASYWVTNLYVPDDIDTTDIKKWSDIEKYASSKEVIDGKIKREDSPEYKAANASFLSKILKAATR